MTLRILRIALIIIIPLILLMIFSSWIMEWVWLRELGYADIFRVLKSTQVMMFLGAFLLSGIYLMINFRFLARQLQNSRLVTTIIGSLNIAIPADRQYKVAAPRIHRRITDHRLYFCPGDHAAVG